MCGLIFLLGSRYKINCTLSGIIFGGFALVGCVPEYIKPQSDLVLSERLHAAQMVKGINITKESWPSQNWWEAFGDGQLNKLVHEALSNAPDLRAAEARIRQADAMTGVVNAALWPNVEGAASFARNRTSLYGMGNGQWNKLYDAKINVAFDLDLWGKNRAALEAEIGLAKVQEVDYNATRLSLSSSIVQAYINLQQIYDELNVQQALLRTNENLLNLTQQRYTADLDSLVSVKQALAAIPANRSQIAALKESLALTHNQLAMLLGKGPDRGSRISPPRLKVINSVTIPGNLPAELLGHRPDVVAQRWMVESAGNNIKVAKTEYYPNINLSSFIGLQSLSFSNLRKRNSYEFSIGPALSLPIFEGGKLDANLAEATAAYDIAVENYNSILTSALQDLADQLTSLRWLQERLLEQRDAVQTAQESADLAEALYTAGLTSYLQVISTQSAVFSQKLQLVQLQSRGLSLQAHLSRALGGGYLPNLPSIIPFEQLYER